MPACAIAVEILWPFPWTKIATESAESRPTHLLTLYNICPAVYVLKIRQHQQPVDTLPMQ